MPRVLNMYSHDAVLHRLLRSRSACKAENLVYSDYTSEQLYKEGAKRGAIDPCFPSKLGIPHVHNLLYVHAREEAARHHLLPDDRLPDQRPARHVQASRAARPWPPRRRR